MPTIIWYRFSFQIVIASGNGTASKEVTCDDPQLTEAVLRLNEILAAASSSSRLYGDSYAGLATRFTVKVAAVNPMGMGPFSREAVLEVGQNQASLYGGGRGISGRGPVESAQYTWLVALLGTMAFMLILVASVLIYYRRRGHGSKLYLQVRPNNS